MKKQNWTTWIITLIAIITFFWTIFFKPTFDRLERIERETVETKLEVAKTKIMLGVQQATLDKIERKIP